MQGQERRRQEEDQPVLASCGAKASSGGECSLRGRACSGIGARKWKLGVAKEEEKKTPSEEVKGGNWLKGREELW